MGSSSRKVLTVGVSGLIDATVAICQAPGARWSVGVSPSVSPSNSAPL